MQATHDTLLDIVKASINLSNVRMGRQPVDLTYVNADTAISMYKNVQSEFMSMFSAGQHSSSPAADTKEEEQPPLHPAVAASLKARLYLS
jgi:hypothetical protein